MGSLFQELKQRKVFRVAGIYIVAAWLIIQVTDTVSPLMDMPASTPQLVLFVLIFLFPFSLVLAWFFEITYAGIKIQTGEEAAPEKPLSNKQTVVYGLVGLLGVVATFFFVNLFVVSEDLEPGFSLQQAASTGSPVTEETIIPPRENSIAVLPFDDMSPDGDQEYMSDGIAEEMLNLLAKIPELRVTARTSAFSFKNTTYTIPEIGQRLNVAYILEGSVRKAGNQIRITTQLIETSSDIHIWSETYTRELDDVFAIQDEISAEVVAKLELTLSGEVVLVRKIDPEAYTLYLQARHLEEQADFSNHESIIELYQNVLALAPAYPPALVGLAGTMGNNEPGSYDKALALLDRALEIDPNYAPAIAFKGLIAIAESDVAGAAGYIRQAFALDPTDPDVLFAGATMYQTLGRSGVALAEYVVSIDPVNANARLGLAGSFTLTGRLDESIASARTALILSPNASFAHFVIGDALFQSGNLEAALAEAEQELLEMHRLILLIEIYYAMGEQTKSDALLQELIEGYAQENPYFIAWPLAYRDEADLAFEYLDKAVAIEDNGLYGLNVNTGFSNLYQDPRWIPFLEKIGRSPEQLDAIEFEVIPPSSIVQ